MFVAQAGERRINRADHKLDIAPLESEHFRIAKRLRDYRVTRIQITEPHLFCRLCLFLSLMCKGHKGQRERRTQENRTSFPGSISKSSASESSVFGLITSSMNF